MALDNKNKIFISLLIVIAAISTIFKTINRKEEINKTIYISAASSLSSAMDNIIEKFKNLHPEITVRISIGGSGYLATQIENGAPVDILISADERDADRLILKNIVKNGSRFILCRNTLVLAGFKNYKQGYSYNELKSILNSSRKIGIGNPDYVAAGLYAKNLLLKEGLFDEFSSKLVQGNSVVQVVSWLKARDVDFAFIYKTDVLLNQNIIIYREYSNIGNTEITYPALLTKKGELNPDAELFYNFLKSNNSRNILTNYGFITENLNGNINQS